MTDLPKLVIVEWTDAYAGAGWSDVFQSPTEVLTAGYLVAEELDYVVVCACYDPDTKQSNACITIPRVCITKLEPILV